MNTSSTKTSGDRLVDAIQFANVNPRDDWSHLLDKMNRLSLTDAEYDYFVAAVENASDKALMIELLASGIWDVDRGMMHVMTRSFPYIVQIIKGDSETAARKPTGRACDIYGKMIYSAWIKASRENTITASEYDDMSAYLNASYAAQALYLHTSVKSSLAAMREITVPLMENQNLVTPAMSVIVEIWETLRKSRIGESASRYITTANVLEIAEMVRESPEVAPLLVKFAAERGYFNAEVAMEYVKNPSRALVEGVL